MNIQQHNHQRDITIDAMRGIAVMLMILAHAIFFFHDGTSVFLNLFERFANTVTLTLFIFVSGISTAKSAAKSSHLTLKEQSISTVKYIGVIYFVYATAVIVYFALTREVLTDIARSEKIISALVFLSPPNFMEYMILFMFFPLLSHVRRLSGYIKHVQLSQLIIGVSVCYAAGLYLYTLPAEGVLLSIKELIVGGDQLLRFPLLFYLPIYMVGMWWESRHSPLVLGLFSIFTLTLHISSIALGSPVLSLDVRWPPSVGFLTVGVTTAMFIQYALMYLSTIPRVRRVTAYVSYIGKDALDFWLSHIVILLIYQYAISYKSPHILVVLSMTVAVLLISTIVSSIGITNAISLKKIGPLSIVPLSTRRFRKRYITLLFFSGLVIGTTLLTVPSNTLYGSAMPSNSFAGIVRTSEIREVRLHSERKWHIRSGNTVSSVDISLEAFDQYNKPASVESSRIQLYAAQSLLSNAVIDATDTGARIRIPASVFPSGTIELSAKIQSADTYIETNTVSILVSEPLYVAWTFDWEGWEVSQDAIAKLIEIQKIYAPIPYTHFVNPRIFITNSLSETQNAYSKEYLLNQQSAGNEIALHLHMHYDLVEAAGVTPQTKTHWGLRSAEGYDVPTTEYTPQDFEKIVAKANDILQETGFTNVNGYRAGGWFISTEQLQVLQSLGFTYDSSGRDKPASGAFKNIPWNLPLGAQPYTISSGKDGEHPGQTFLEIPNNGGSTYEQTVAELRKRISDVYISGPLDEPKSLVFVSHPQFASREFPKIPEILNTVLNQSYRNDTGPVVFSTVRDIQTQWKSQ